VHLTISQRSDIPIYQQIEQQVIQQILTGELPGGYKLPSIRNLAQELHISVITVKKAYEELERENYVITMAARGSYVADHNEKQLAKSQIRRIETILETAVDEAMVLQVTEEQMHEILQRLYQQRQSVESFDYRGEQ
jgi:GntR family transcriptional regulator